MKSVTLLDITEFQYILKILFCNGITLPDLMKFCYTTGTPLHTRITLLDVMELHDVTLILVLEMMEFR